MTIEGTASFAVRPEGLDRALMAIGSFVAHTETEPGTPVYVSWRSATRPYEFQHSCRSSTRRPSRPTPRATPFEPSPRRCIRCAWSPRFGEWHAVRERRTKEGR
jgi:hypothetical protein